MQRAVLLAGAAVALLAAQATAEAAPISTARSALLSSTPLTFTVGGSGTFSFTLDTTSFAPAADVSTSGTGMVTTIFAGTPFASLADFGAGSAIDGASTELYTFAAYPAATLIPFSQADDFIGLSYTGSDGVHYGYAEVSGNAFLGYAFESTPGASITTAAVPEPASLALLGVGALVVGGLRSRSRVAKLAA